MPRWREPTAKDYDRLIAFFDELGLAAFRPMQRQCKRERKSLVMREKALRQHQDVEFQQRFRGGRAAAFRDCGRETIRLQKFRESFRKVPRALPPMTPDQLREYKRLLHEGAKRPDALNVILSPRNSSGDHTSQSTAGAKHRPRVLVGPPASNPAGGPRDLAP